jgi:hypothetical protein
MKEGELLNILRDQGCVFVKHCKKLDKYIQPRTGITDHVPRHPKIYDMLARQIIKNLS